MRLRDGGPRPGAWRCAAAGLLAAVLGPPPAAGAAAEKQEHLVPADKGLSAEWVRALFERGGPEVWRGEALTTVGMPCGGVAAGQLYLRGDGTLAAWRIFNKHENTGYGSKCYRTERPPSPVESGFALTVRAGGKTHRRRLCQEDFPGVAFVGEYPLAVVRYEADDFPADVEMEAFSPFIPLNPGDSALPATLFHIRVANPSREPMAVGLEGWLENAVLIHSRAAVRAVRRCRLVGEKGRTLLVHTAEKAPPPEGPEKPRPTIVLADFEGEDYGDWKVEGEAFGEGPARGTLPEQQEVSGFLGKGLVNTYLGKDPPHGTLTSPPFTIRRRFIQFLIGGGKHEGTTCIQLLVDGQVVRTAVGRNDEKLLWHFWNVGPLEGKEARIRIVDRASGGWGHINIDHIELTDTVREAPGAPLEELPDYGSLVLAFAGRPTARAAMTVEPISAEGEATSGADAAFPALERRRARVVLEPEQVAGDEAATFTVVLAWHFPNHPHGREYATRFDDAAQVAHYVLDHHDRLAAHTRLWHRTYYEDSTLPRWLLFRLHSTASNLATNTCQWWASGRFWAWEGVGCCPGTCTHVWNYAHTLARLFPQLERSAREMQDFGAGFDPRTGLVGFRSNRAYAADGQCGTVLKAYREHTMSPDEAFLRRTWPRIRKALEFAIRQDGDGDGLIEGGQHNTFDISFHGPNTFVGSLYLAALRAGEQMAREMGEEPFARRCRTIFERGREASAERLFDGEYFIQLVDLEKHPKHQYGRGCLSDQLFGQGWAHQLALGYLYPPEQVRSALQAVWQYNWAPDVGPYNQAHRPGRVFARPGEAGLFTCTWPKSPYLAQGVRYKNEVWTGIEYQVAGHMVWEGRVEQALAICRGIHERYHPAKHNPYNEVECGDHYARALASWGVYTALAGYEVHGPGGHLGFAPRISPAKFQAAFTAPEGWGSFAQRRDAGGQRERIEVRWGRLRLRSLAFALPQGLTPSRVAVAVDGEAVEATHALEGQRLSLSLAEELVLREGQALDVTIR
ncbi:MAG: GH116 family glycosyl hydrolase [Candidatus Brocadiia bacterium]